MGRKTKASDTADSDTLTPVKKSRKEIKEKVVKDKVVSKEKVVGKGKKATAPPKRKQVKKTKETATAETPSSVDDTVPPTVPPVIAETTDTLTEDVDVIPPSGVISDDSIPAKEKGKTVSGQPRKRLPHWNFSVNEQIDLCAWYEEKELVNSTGGSYEKCIYYKMFEEEAKKYKNKWEVKCTGNQLYNWFKNRRKDYTKWCRTCDASGAEATSIADLPKVDNVLFSLYQKSNEKPPDARIHRQSLKTKTVSVLLN